MEDQPPQMPRDKTVGMVPYAFLIYSSLFLFVINRKLLCTYDVITFYYHAAGKETVDLDRIRQLSLFSVSPALLEHTYLDSQVKMLCFVWWKGINNGR